MSENIQCPYCLNETEYEDSVYDGEEIEWECPDCEKSSIHTADVRITFTAQSDCEANNEEHAFVKSLARSSTENNYYVYVCKKCDVVTRDSDLVPRMSVREQVVVG